MSSPEFHKQFSDWNMCVLIPTYNHGETLVEIIEGMLYYTNDIIVVNDGSTDNTREYLSAFENRLTVVHLPKNKGKGEALRSGFKIAVQKGFDRCMTIDSDGQHFPSDVPVFLEGLKNHPDGLLIGTRTLDHADVPGASTFGNKFANFWYWVITGRKLKDTQSGFRVYPLMQMKKMKFYSHRYEYEAEILIRLSWLDMDIIPVPINVYYPPGDERITHFKKVKDFTRITLLNIYLLILAIVYWHPVRIIRSFKKKGFKELLHQHILSSDHSNPRISAALMVGVFFGVAPIWGFQMLAIILICFLLNLNKPLSLLIAQISLPPFIPFIIFLSYKIGGWFISTFTSMPIHEISFDKEIGLEDLGNGVFQYALGAVLLGGALAAIVGLISMVVLTKYRKIKPESEFNTSNS